MNSQRLDYIDNLRLVVVLLVIILHTSIAYMFDAPEWWYVVDAQNSLFFTALVLVIDVPLMLIMFFVAGFFAYPSLVKRGGDAFLRDKFLRLGVPWVAGIFIFAPLVTYLIYLSRDIPVSFWQFYTVDFWGPLYQQSVYWFLGVLLTLFLILMIFSSAVPGWNKLERKNNQPPRWLIPAFILLGSVWFFAMNQLYPLDTWAGAGYVLIYQPERLLLYALYFGLGVYADRAGWLREGGFQPGLGWMTVLVLSGGAYLYQRMFVVPVQPDVWWVDGVTALLFNLYCFSALMGGLALFRTNANTNQGFWGRWAANSYGIYYLHPVILYPLTYLFLALPVSIFVKAGLLIVITAVVSWLGSAYVLKKAPLTRAMF